MRLSVELRDRTKQFASHIVRFYVSLPRQRKELEVLRCSEADNRVCQYCEPQTRLSASRHQDVANAEFCSKLDGALQEADESQLWLELLRDDCGIMTSELEALLIEADELIAIFATMVAKTKRN